MDRNVCPFSFSKESSVNYRIEESGDLRLTCIYEICLINRATKKGFDPFSRDNKNVVIYPRQKNEICFDLIRRFIRSPDEVVNIRTQAKPKLQIVTMPAYIS